MTVSKSILMSASILGAFAFERWFSFFFPYFFSIPPLAVFAIASWLFALPSGGRIALAVLGGFILDSLSLFPPGTYSAVFLLYGGAAAAVKANFTEARQRVVSIAWGTMVFSTAPLAAIGSGIVISLARAGPFRVSLAEFGEASAAALFWAAAYALLCMGVIALVRRIDLPRLRSS